MSRVEQLKELQSSLKAKLAEGKSKLSLINEEQTKQFYILRLLSLLGYDSTVEGEIVPEAPVNAGDRIDYLLRVNNEEVAIIECKKLGHVLNNKDIAQLQRYYTDKVKVKLAILTNGDDYLLFTDTQEINVMDKIPYKSFRVSSLTDYNAFDELAKENISSIYIPYKENVISQDKAALEQELKQNKKQLDAATKKLATLEGKVYLTEAQKQEQLEIKARALRLENENKSLKNKLNVVKACSPAIQDRVGPKVTYGTAFDKQEVPSNIAKDMVDMIPDDLLVPESTFMDICCRYGEFLIAIYNRLMEAPAMIKAFPDSIDRHDHITQNQLYALMPDEKGLREVTKTLFRTSNVGKSNIIAFKNIEEYSKAINVYKELKYVNGDILTKSEREILEKLGDMMYMKFDIVVSNPPYNDDQYIDFVNLGESLSSKLGIYITPAKWQAKGGKKNEQFRKDIVPRMKEIVFFPVATDLFDEIKEWDGITYYSIDKKVHNMKSIGNVCKWQPLFNNNRERELGYHINNKALSIIDKVVTSNGFKQLKFNYSTDYYTNKNIMKSLVYNANDINNIKVVGGDTRGIMRELGWTSLDDLGHQESVYQYKVIMHGMPGRNGTLVSDGTSYGTSELKILDPGVVCKNAYMVLKTSDNKQDLENFISYINTRFIRFLTYCGCVGSQAGADEYWRFVPSPDSFDHIFTDDELYKKYNLTQDEINIIESVIKERKSK